nr:nucleotidyltransferase family protein [Desulforamulus aquiferis]
MNRIVVAGYPVAVFSNEEWLLYLIFHGAGHAWFRIRWLVDIAKFVQKGGIDWEKVVSLAKNMGILPLLHQTLILTNMLLSIPVPTNIEPSLAKDRYAWNLVRLTVPFLSNTDLEAQYTKRDWLYRRRYYELQFQIGWKNKINYIFHLFQPLRDDMRIISLPNKLYMVYYFIRPFSWFMRCIRDMWQHNKTS